MVPKNDKKNQKRPVKNNFLEALRDLSSDVAKTAVHDLAGGIAKDAVQYVTGRQISGELKPNQSVDVKKAALQNQDVYQEKKDRFRQFNQEYLDIRRQESLIYKRAEQETKIQIAAILEELKKLSLSTKSLAKEVQIAAVQVPMEPGAYHLNFFEKLRETILFLRKKVDESATWLEAFNNKSKKRGFYWNQFKKSGSKFLLSQERYMSTQAG